MNYRNRFIQSPPSSPSMNPFMNPRSKSMYWQGSGQQPKCLPLSTGGIQRHDQTDQTASPSTGGIYQRGRTAAPQILAEFEQGLVELGCIFAARDPELSAPPPGAQDYRRTAPPNRAGGRDCRAEPCRTFPILFCLVQPGAALRSQGFVFLSFLCLPAPLGGVVGPCVVVVNLPILRSSYLSISIFSQSMPVFQSRCAGAR